MYVLSWRTVSALTRVLFYMHYSLYALDKHPMPFCNRNMHTCVHFCYKMVHCGIWGGHNVGFMQQVYYEHSRYFIVFDCVWVRVDFGHIVLDCLTDIRWMAWWRHQMETFSALLALCAGNSPVNSPHKGQWRGALMFSLIFVWRNGWVNNREAGDLRRHRAHYGVTVMISCGYMKNISRIFIPPKLQCHQNKANTT